MTECSVDLTFLVIKDRDVCEKDLTPDIRHLSAQKTNCRKKKKSKKVFQSREHFLFFFSPPHSVAWTLRHYEVTYGPTYACLQVLSHLEFWNLLNFSFSLPFLFYCNSSLPLWFQPHSTAKSRLPLIFSKFSLSFSFNSYKSLGHLLSLDSLVVRELQLFRLTLSTTRFHWILFVIIIIIILS